MDATRFVYGFYHDQYQTELGQTNRVDQILIDDESLDMTFAARQTIIFAELQVDIIGDARGQLFEGMIAGDERQEWGITVAITHDYPGVSPQYFFSRQGWSGEPLDEGSYSRWLSLGTFLLADCGFPSKIKFQPTFVEWDPINSEWYRGPTREIWFNNPSALPNPNASQEQSTRTVLESFGCQDLRTAIGNRPQGVVDSLKGLDLVPDSRAYLNGEIRLRFDLR